MEFIDAGVQYNPLEKEDPDITLNAEDRPIGGLGIFMVKNYMDEVNYIYEHGNNILTINDTEEFCKDLINITNIPISYNNKITNNYIQVWQK